MNMNEWEYYKIGDLVARRPHPYYHSAKPIVGVVVDILEPQIYDRGERVLVQWTCGGKSYEKEFNLERLTNAY